jgi:hypothetical protein
VLTAARTRFSVVAALCGLAASPLCFADFFASRGDHIAGNFGDARLIIYIHEHWYHAFRGQEAWLSPPFYFPARNVLAYSHTLFLQAIPYSCLRRFGLDPYSAFEVTLILFAFVGYGFMISLLRRLGVSRACSVLGGILFAFSNLFHIWILAPQSYTVMLIPMLAVLIIKALDCLPARRLAAGLLLAIAGALLSLMLFSEFYTGWFLVLLAACILVITLLMHQELIPRLLAFISANRVLVLVTVLAALAALVPFFITYGPAIGRNEHREFHDVMDSAIPFADIVNVHGGNLVWGRLLARLGAAYSNLGRAYGFPPGLLLAFLAVAGSILLRRPIPPLDRGDKRSILLSGSAVAVLVSWALLFKVGDSSLWYLVWRVVPGASAIRVTPRLQFVLSIIVVMVVITALSGLWDAAAKPSLQGRRRRRDPVASSAIVIVAAFLVLEQVNTASSHTISRQQESARLGRIERPAFSCDSFFLVSSTDQQLHPVALQLDAMLVSQRLGVPTVNGYSGFAPPGWELSIPQASDYLAKVESWARTNQLQRLCALDVGQAKWIAPGRLPESKTAAVRPRPRPAAGPGARRPAPGPRAPAGRAAG